MRLRGGGCSSSKPPVAELDDVVVPAENSTRTAPVIDHTTAIVLFATEPAVTPASNAPASAPAYATTSMLSFLSSDPDRVHDKKLIGLQIDLRVTTAKNTLRRIRNAVNKTAKFYRKYASEPKKGSWALTLPELAEWSRHETFFGEVGAATVIFRHAAHLAALSQLAAKMRGRIGEGGVAYLNAASKSAEAGIEKIHAFELRISHTTHARETAAKALRKAATARDAAAADEQKAVQSKDEKKKVVAVASAQKAIAKAQGEASEAQASLQVHSRGTWGSGCAHCRLRVTAPLPLASPTASLPRRIASRTPASTALLCQTAEEELLALADTGVLAVLSAAEEAREEAEAVDLAAACAEITAAYEGFAQAGSCLGSPRMVLDIDRLIPVG